MYPKIKVRKAVNAFFSYTFVTAIMLNSRSVWMHLNHTGGKFSECMLLLLVGSLFGYLLTKGQLNYNYLGITMMIILIVTGYIGFWLVITNYKLVSGSKFILATATILSYYYLSDVKERREVLLRYRNVVLFVATLSMICWLLFSMLKLGSPTSHVFSTWTNTGDPKPVASYYGIYFESQILHGFVRNTAIFTEAPMASLQFTIGFLIEFLVSEKVHPLNRILFTLAILSTTSTTGILLVLFFWLYTIISAKNYGTIIALIKVTIVPVALIAAVIIANVMLTAKMGESSGSIRTDDFIVGMKAWSHKPLLGNGFNNSDAIKAFMGGWRSYNTGFSNSITQLLAQGGLCMFLLYMLPIFSNFKNFLRNRKYRVFLIGFLYLFTFTMFTYQYILILLIAFLSDRAYESPDLSVDKLKE
ncbi:hypothetical protein E0E02_01715 [Streptococcus sp. KCJ4932]|uniref:hypothetical protein n=1 Tax=Streptococcus sp. KCJ4932 TaxID=2545465 RepID=UPI0010569FC2|nr:hypothetical protein [Streptococcus sp. KCJ4932]TDE68809.1 hypothetical protein E0E02_01715 [Streptococcus sp. KCJ4932]